LQPVGGVRCEWRFRPERGGEAGIQDREPALLRLIYSRWRRRRGIKIHSVRFELAASSMCLVYTVQYKMHFSCTQLESLSLHVIVARLRQPPLMAAGPASASLHGPSDQAACAGDTRLFGPWERSSPLMISWAHHQRAPQPSGAHARPGHHKLHQRRATVRAPFHTSSTARPWGSNCLPRRAADPRSIRRCRRSAVCIARPAPCTRAVSIATGCRLKRMGGCRTWQLGSSLQS